MEQAWLNYKDMVTQAVTLAVPDYDGMMSGRNLAGCIWMRPNTGLAPDSVSKP